MGATASQITGILIIYSTIFSGADQRKYQGSASLTFERGIHRSPVGSPHKGPVTRKCIYLMTSWCLWLWLIILKASCYLNHAISEFFITKMTARIILTEISCKFIFFTLEIVGLVQWTWKCILLPNWWYMYNHDYDVVRDFQLITLVGKCDVMDLYINIASLHGADAYWSIIVGFFFINH